MSAIASTSPTTRNSLLRLSVIGGLIIGLLHLIVQIGSFLVSLKRTPLFLHCNM
jgi:hypothetical protein